MVEDTGVGIDAEDIPRIGDPFFQARSSYDRRHAGTGLGLSIVKGLLALHGGRLDIASRFGEGTKITIRLPIGLRAWAPPGNNRGYVDPAHRFCCVRRSDENQCLAPNAPAAPAKAAPMMG